MQVAINVIFQKSILAYINKYQQGELYSPQIFWIFMVYVAYYILYYANIMIFEFGICSIIETSSCLYLSSNAFIHVYLVCLITTTHNQITSFSISFIIKILIKCLLKTDKLYIVNMHLLIKSVYYFN